MLPKSARLKKKKDIEKVLKTGRKFKEDFLILAISKNSFGKIRFGCIVSQAVSKKATIRNKLKRRLRELIQVKLNKMQKGIDGIIIALPGLETKDFWEIETAVNRLFQKAQILIQLR